MMRNGKGQIDVDVWLNRVFPDDLPRESEAEMAAQLDRFKKEWEQAGKARTARTLRPRLLTLIQARIALAAASIVLIVLGFFIRPKSPPTALASSLATLQKAVSVSGQVGGGRAMECTARLDEPGDASSLYVIRWISPEETLVRIVLAGEESLLTIRPRKTERSVLELVSRSIEEELGEQQRLGPELLPVEDLLTSSRLRRLLDGRWLPAGVERTDGCDWESFSIATRPGEPSSKVTVDTCTFLPVKLEKDLDKGGKLEAVFHWLPQSGPGTASRTIPS